MPGLASVQDDGKETKNKIFALNLIVIQLDSTRRRKAAAVCTVHMTSPEPGKQFLKDGKLRCLWTIARPERRKRRYLSSRRVMV